MMSALRQTLGQLFGGDGGSDSPSSSRRSSAGGAGAPLRFVLGASASPSALVRRRVGEGGRYIGAGFEQYDDLLVELSVRTGDSGKREVFLRALSGDWPVVVDDDTTCVVDQDLRVRPSTTIRVGGTDFVVRELLRGGREASGGNESAQPATKKSRSNGASNTTNVGTALDPPAQGAADTTGVVADKGEAAADKGEAAADKGEGAADKGEGADTDDGRGSGAKGKETRASRPSASPTTVTEPDDANGLAIKGGNGLRALAPGSGEGTVVKDFAQLRSDYKWLHPASVKIAVRPHEEDKFGIGRMHGASEAMVVVFTDKENVSYLTRIFEVLRNNGYQYHVRLCTSDVLSQIREEVQTAGASDAVTKEDFELYTRFSQLVAEAIRLDASDIHIEVREGAGSIRCRVHGELFTLRTVAQNYAQKMVRAVYNISAGGGSSMFSDADLHQGRIDDEFGGVRAGLRVQSDPCFMDGTFDFVMRIMVYETSKSVLHPEAMGFHATQAADIRRQAARPVGSIVVAGATGSGKSTTMYHLLRWRAQFYQNTRKIITVEDPVERRIPEATQMEINKAREETAGSDDGGWVNYLSAAMRSDPDILFIGEVRDGKSASLFERATITGHQTLTTLHTNDPFSIISRLVDLGVDTNVLASHQFLNCIIHQRLVQHVCHDCSRSVEEYREAQTGEMFEDFCNRVETFFGPLAASLRCRGVRGGECSTCKGLTIVGRSVCAEVVATDNDEMRDLLRPETLVQGRRLWERQGHLTAFGHGTIKVLDGLLAPEDLEGAVDPIPNVPLPEYFGEDHIVTKHYREVLEHGTQ